MSIQTTEFPTIAIVGFGALGALFASLLAPQLPFDKDRKSVV